MYPVIEADPSIHSLYILSYLEMWKCIRRMSETLMTYDIQSAVNHTAFSCLRYDRCITS